MLAGRSLLGRHRRRYAWAGPTGFVGPRHGPRDQGANRWRHVGVSPASTPEGTGAQRCIDFVRGWLAPALEPGWFLSSWSSSRSSWQPATHPVAAGRATDVRPMRGLLAIALLLVGLVWIGQGTGLIGGSVMTNQAVWAVLGGVLIAGAAVLAWIGRRRTLGG